MTNPCIDCGGKCCKINEVERKTGRVKYILVTNQDLERNIPLELICVDDDGKHSMKTDESGCVHQDKQTNLCNIYEMRPDYCRLFPFDIGIVRVPVTGEDEYVVWRDRKLELKIRKSMEYWRPVETSELLEFYSTTNLIYPILVLKSCPYSQKLTSSEALKEMRTSIHIVESNPELFMHCTPERIYTINSLRKMRDNRSILGYAILSHVSLHHSSL